MVVLGTLVASMAPVLTAPQVAPAGAAPGNPGVPDDPIVRFAEDFENVPDGTTSVMLDAYVGEGGETYTADPSWVDPDQCNGFILTGASPDHPGACSTENQNQLRTLATNLGTFNGTEPADTNFAVAAYTAGDPGASNVQFATVDPLDIEVENRFLSFSVNVSAVNCGVSAPQLRFYLVDGDAEIPATTDAINPCAEGTGTFATDGSILFTGDDLGIVMRNDNGSGSGNDHAFDDIRLLDTTPQLDKQFSPTVAPVGVPVDLVFTVTNTSELAAKQGWSFVDTLPEGLTIADPASATTDCSNGDITVTGADTIDVSGDLEAGQVACTASVSVLFSQAGTYVNDASNISGLVGLDPPGPSQVTSTGLPAFECTSTGFLSQGSPANLYEVDVVTGENELVAEEFFPENINAIGFNPLDGYIYGWITSGPEGERGIARVGSDHQVEYLGYPFDWDDFDLGPSHHIGDFDNDGHLWLSNGVNGYWVEIDLAPGSDTYMQVLDTGALTPPLAGYSFADWAFNPQDELLYIAAAGPSDNKRLWTFDPDTETLEDAVDLGNIVDGAFGGAVYSDANNNMFTSHNSSGEIWHIDLPDGPASFLADGPIAPANDGAICFNVVILPLGPVVDVTKTADPIGPLAPGSTIEYTVTATNVGNLAGVDVLVEDPLPEGIESGTWTCAGAACPNESGDLPLSETLPLMGIEESVVYTIDAQVSEDPPAEIVNTATVSGPEVTCADATVAPCDATATNSVLPIVTVDKTAGVEMAAPGDTVSYEIEVANVGQGPLDGEMVVTDPLPDGLVSGTWECVAVGGAVCPDADGAMPLAATVTELPAGAVLTYTVDAVVSDDPADEIVNVVTVEGPVTCQADPITAPPCEDEVTVVVERPSLALVKTAEVERGEVSVADVGDTIQYMFAVSNTGNVTMSDIDVDDPLPGLSTVVCPLDTLAPDETMTCTASYVVTQADVDAGGSVVNVATASGLPPGGDTGDRISSPSGGAEVALVDAAPSLVLEKVAEANGAAEPGDQIAYRFEVTNTGNVTLNDVAVDDPQLGSVTCPETVLGPGESVTCTGDSPYVVTEADGEAGQVVNIASASADGPEATDGAEVLAESVVVVTRLAGTSLPVTGAGLAALLLAGAGLLFTGTGLVAGGRRAHGSSGALASGSDPWRPAGRTLRKPRRSWWAAPLLRGRTQLRARRARRPAWRDLLSWWARACSAWGSLRAPP